MLPRSVQPAPIYCSLGWIEGLVRLCGKSQEPGTWNRVHRTTGPFRLRYYAANAHSRVYLQSMKNLTFLAEIDNDESKLFRSWNIVYKPSILSGSSERQQRFHWYLSRVKVAQGVLWIGRRKDIHKTSSGLLQACPTKELVGAPLTFCRIQLASDIVQDVQTKCTLYVGDQLLRRSSKGPLKGV